MLVRCVTSNWWSAMTLDKRYEVIEEQLGLYKVINDSGVPYYYPIEYFEEVKKMSEKITLKIFTKCGVGFEATKENADILIKMAKLAEELK